MAIIPAAVTLSAVTSVVGQATGITTVGFLDSPDYTIELAALQAQVATMSATITSLNAEIATINTALLATNAALTTISADMTLLLQFLTAVQTPTGEFRTFDFNSVSDNTLVTSALAKTGIPVPPNPGI